MSLQLSQNSDPQPSPQTSNPRLWIMFILVIMAALLPFAFRLFRTSDAVPSTPNPHPTLSDYWDGRAEWSLEDTSTGLPVGESDTLYKGNGEYWSYLHASYTSAGVLDSCGDPVDFPGCVTHWVSTDGGHSFSLSEPRCLLDCRACPCDEYDHTNQQQYPRVLNTPQGYFMVYEHHAALFMTSSRDGLTWSRPWNVKNTGVWNPSEGDCPPSYTIGTHPFATSEDQCMAGGPPGLAYADGKLYIFMGLGQNPGHMGCFWAWASGPRRFAPCNANPLFTAVSEYGPTDALGSAANPYFDFRYTTSADVLKVGDMFYMAYEGIRGPESFAVGGDSQFALGFARSPSIDALWEEFPGNPILQDVSFNYGIGHADLLVVDGVTIMYTATPQMQRGRYILVWKP